MLLLLKSRSTLRVCTAGLKTSILLIWSVELRPQGIELTEDRATPLFLFAGALYDICNQDALCVVEQELFDKLYSLIRCASNGAHDLGEYHSTA